VHAVASLPEPERVRFWHEQFMPLAAQEHALREQPQVVGQGRTPEIEMTVRRRVRNPSRRSRQPKARLHLHIERAAAKSTDSHL
jgi:hypothetical protein